MTHAFIFPGQGAQTIGMGKDLADNFPASKAVFEEVDEALDQKLSDLIWEGDADTLMLTENAQPALMATSMAVMRAMQAEGVDISRAAFVAGHSLGEYSALCAAGALALADTARLLRVRGQAMQAAVPIGVGAMAAILGLDFATVRDIADAAKGQEICQAANDNDPAQVVVSGHKAAVERAIDLAKEAGAKRAVLLPVSAPFHCALMQPAADVMARALETVVLKSPCVPLIANVRACAFSDAQAIKDMLVEQVVGSVRWRETVEYMAENNVKAVYEIGAGKALCGMVRRIDRAIEVNAIGDTNALASSIEKIK